MLLYYYFSLFFLILYIRSTNQAKLLRIEIQQQKKNNQLRHWLYHLEWKDFFFSSFSDFQNQKCEIHRTRVKNCCRKYIYRFYLRSLDFFFQAKICYCAKIIFSVNWVWVTRYKLHVIIVLCINQLLPLLPCSISLFQLISPAKQFRIVIIFSLLHLFNSMRTVFFCCCTETKKKKKQQQH